MLASCMMILQRVIILLHCEHYNIISSVPWGFPQEQKTFVLSFLVHFVIGNIIILSCFTHFQKCSLTGYVPSCVKYCTHTRVKACTGTSKYCVIPTRSSIWMCRVAHATIWLAALFLMHIRRLLESTN